MTLYKRILFLPIIFLFLPACVIFLSENTYFTVISIILCISYILIIMQERFNIIKRFFYYYNTTCAKYFFYLFIWIIISGINAVIHNYYTFSRFIFVAVFAFIFRALIIYLYPIFVIPKYFSLKMIIKSFTMIYFLIFIWGFIEIIGATFKIEIINFVEHLLSNIKDFEHSIVIQHTNIPRIRSVFMEPSCYAQFITLSLPFLYEIFKSKYKIFKDVLLNKIIKKSILPLAIVSLFLTQSPIFIILSLIIFPIILYKQILFFVIKNYKIITILLFVISFLLLNFSLNIDLSNTFFNRFLTVLSIFKNGFNLYDLTIQESSLGTRIVNIVNQVKLSFHYPIFGIGFGNVGHILMNFYANSDIPLTEEMQFILAKSSGTFSVTTNAMALLLFQTGFVGFALYCFFMIKNLIILNRVKKFFSGIEYAFIVGLRNMLLIIFILSIVYQQQFVDNYLLFLCGLVCSIMIITKQKIHKIKFSLQNNKVRIIK